MVPYRYRTVERDLEGGENFEALVDLFTLLSFVLIIASFVFGIYQVKISEKIAEVEVAKVKSGGPPVAIPEDIAFIVILKTNKTDVIRIDKGDYLSENYVADDASISSILTRELNNLEAANEIHLVLFTKAIKDPNYRLLYETERWLAGHGLTKLIKHFQ
jgi:hypothetical protein